MCFQGTFAIITAALISGAIVERMRFSAYVVFISLWALCRLQPDRALGVGRRLAGGHGRARLRRRHGRARQRRRGRAGGGAGRRQAQRLQVVGAACRTTCRSCCSAPACSGSAGSGSTPAARSPPTHRPRSRSRRRCWRPAGTLVVWTLLDAVRQQKSTAVGAATAIVVGLVAITPAAGFVGPMSAIALGAIAAVPSYFALVWRAKTQLDDSLDVVAAHGVGGTVGALLTGVFAQKALNGVADGLAVRQSRAARHPGRRGRRGDRLQRRHELRAAEADRPGDSAAGDGGRRGDRPRHHAARRGSLRAERRGERRGAGGRGARRDGPGVRERPGRRFEHVGCVVRGAGSEDPALRHGAECGAAAGADRIGAVVRFRGRNLTTALDWLALGLVVAALAISLSGGFSFRLGGVRIRAQDPVRAALVAFAVIAIRAAFDRRTCPLASAPTVFRWIRDRVYRAGADSVRRIRDRVYRDAADSAVPLPEAGAWRRRGLAALGFCVFATVLLFPQLRHMDSVPDLGDPLFSIWRSGWVHHKLAGDPRPLFSPNIFHPHQFTLTYSDSMLLPALTTVPLLALGVHPVVAYNVVFVCSFVASAFAMYLLVERLSGSPGAAFVSGLLFGFYPYRFEHYSHFELQMTYCMPLALLFLHRFLTTARARDAIAAAVVSRRQLYSSMYYAVFFTFYLGALLAAPRPPRPSASAKAARPRRDRGRDRAAARLAAGAHLQRGAPRRPRRADGVVLQRHGVRLPQGASAQRHVGRSRAARAARPNAPCSPA